MTRLIILVLVVATSGTPLGTFVCGRACTPVQASAAPGCHEQGGSDRATPTVNGLHLCDQDVSVAPSVVRAAFAFVASDGNVPSVPAFQAAVQRHPLMGPWKFPPGVIPVSHPSAEASLRI